MLWSLSAFSRTMSLPVPIQSTRWPIVCTTTTATAMLKPQASSRSGTETSRARASTRALPLATTASSIIFLIIRATAGLSRGGLARDGVAEQQPLLARRAHAVGAEAGEADAAGLRLLEDTRLVEAGREQGDDVQAGRDSPDLEVRQLARERAHEHVPPPAVAKAHAAEMPVELAALEEVCERELLEPRRRDHRVEHLHRERAHQARGRDQPAEPKGRGKRLAR